MQVHLYIDLCSFGLPNASLKKCQVHQNTAIHLRTLPYPFNIVRAFLHISTRLSCFLNLSQHARTFPEIYILILLSDFDDIFQAASLSKAFQTLTRFVILLQACLSFQLSKHYKHISQQVPSISSHSQASPMLPRRKSTYFEDVSILRQTCPAVSTSLQILQTL